METVVPTENNTVSQLEYIEKAHLLESIKMLKDWSSWLVGIQTAAIAAIAALVKDETNFLRQLFASAAVGSFAVSIVSATYLLVALPAFYLRVSKLRADEDFLIRPAFVGRRSFVPRWSLLRLVGWEQHTFLTGVLFFMLFVILKIYHYP